MMHGPVKCAAGLLLAAIACGSMVHCAKKRSVNIVEPRSLLYVVNSGEPVSVVVFDTETDSSIHEFDLPVAWYFALLDADLNTERVLVSYNDNLRIYSSFGDSLPAQFLLPSNQFAFAGRRSVVVGSSRGGIDGQLDIYEYPRMTSIHTDSIGASQLTGTPVADIVVGITGDDNFGGPPFRWFAYAYNVLDRRLLRIRQFQFDAESPAQLWRCGISPDGSRMYLSASDPNGIYLLGYDLIRDSVLFLEPINSPGGIPEVSPDGSEVWYPDAMLPGWGGPESVKVFDAATGQGLAEIDLVGYRSRPFRPLIPMQVRFTPDGSKAYVLCGDYGGPLIAVDSESRTVLHLLPQDSTRFPFEMDIGAKE